ncbi:MAG TPA: ABC transporter substrate-binding protein [Thermoanaerobaculia bacterium]|nr:ABC transporter substrate-binding protein [Thermoanaerobaculia bacterium]
MPRPGPPLRVLLFLLLAGAPGCGWREAQAPAPPARPLRIALPAEPTTLDPHLQAESAANSILSNLYEGLAAFDAEMGLAPALAAAWESPDELTWVLRLRPGVTFHDGRPLTALDVLFSLQRARDHPESRVASHLVAVGSWRALDERTVEIRTRRPYPILLNKLALVMIVPAGAPAPIDAPVGTGPYRLAGRREGAIELSPHAGHWRGLPAHPAVTIYLEPEPEERVAGLLGGRFDLVKEVPPRLRQTVRASHVARLLGRDTLLVNYLQLPSDYAPFSDPRVREAIQVGIDRRALVEELAGGLGSPAGQMVGPNVFGHAPALAAPEPDLPRARALLAAAGLDRSVRIPMAYRAGRDVGPIVRQLAELGLAIEPRPVPWERLYRSLQAGEVGFYYGGFSCNSGDASDLFDGKVHSREALSGYGSSHSSGLSTAALDELIELAGTASEMPARRQMLERAMRELMAENTLVPLFVPRVDYGVRRTLRWHPRLDGYVRVDEVALAPPP